MNSKKGLISAFTVTWNGKKWLKRYLKSLEKQTYKKLEMIVVDNGSTDGSIEYIEKYYPKVRVIKNAQNYGLAKATKIGVNKSSGEVVLFLNNDTWFEEDFVEKLYTFYKKNDYMVVSASEKRYFNEDEFKCNTTIDITGSPAYYIPTYSKPEKIFYLTVCFLCKKRDFLKTKGTDENFFMYYEDVDWFWRLLLLGKKFAVDTDTFIHHVGAGSTGSGIKYNFFLWRNQNTLQSLLKNYSLVALIFVLPLYFLQNTIEIIFFLTILKPKIASSYIEGWWFNIRHLARTLKKRKWIQQHRKVSDLSIFKKMYMGSGKLLLLRDYLNVK